IAEQARQGAEEFTVRPVLPLYLPGDPIELEVRWWSRLVDPVYPATCKHLTFAPSEPGDCVPHGIPDIGVQIDIYPSDHPENRTHYGESFYPFTEPLRLDAPRGKGLYFIEAR